MAVGRFSSFQPCPALTAIFLVLNAEIHTKQIRFTFAVTPWSVEICNFLAHDFKWSSCERFKSCAVVSVLLGNLRNTLLSSRFTATALGSQFLAFNLQLFSRLAWRLSSAAPSAVLTATLRDLAIRLELIV